MKIVKFIKSLADCCWALGFVRGGMTLSDWNVLLE